jgi:hypothetical protein
VTLNLLVHLVQLSGWEPDGIKREVLVVVGVPYVHPKDIHWEAIILEIVITVDHDLRRNLCILGVVEAQILNWRQRSMACDVS